MIFSNETEIRDLFPYAFDLLDRENKIQYPQASFLYATYGHMGDEDITDLVVIYDINSDKEYLYAWVAHADSVSAYIDEYRELPKDDALFELSNLCDWLYGNN